MYVRKGGEGEDLCRFCSEKNKTTKKLQNELIAVNDVA